VLCRPAPPASSDKNPRFKAVQDRYNVLMFVGDNIQDFPATTQAIRAQGNAAFEHFGVDWIVLPNPMYGSWERL
jgi:acid phosphatase